MTYTPYPVHVGGRLDPALSRWRWLVKWALALPHYLVLALLWPAFVVLSLVALVGIVVTGRYPRSIFEFNVGVLRWTWRVAYYSYGALGTDQYPPFTLRDVPDYPARLDVDYPEHLSRRLALLKWWLLALPHYLVVSFFLGGGVYVAAESNGGSPAVWGGGLIGLLAVIAGVTLLVTGRYPRSVFDLVLGMNRWVLRVAAYAGLMTDAYPPFRLDQGGTDPDRAALSVTAPPGSAVAPSRPMAASAPADQWTAGRVTSVVVGSLMLLGAVGLGVAGGGLAIVDRTMRDGAGFLMSDEVRVSSMTYAVTTERLALESDAPGFIPRSLLGDAKVEATVASGQPPLFVGIGPADEVERYLADVSTATIVGVETNDGSRLADLDRASGGAPSSAPASQQFWAASTTGTGELSMVWPVTEGDWTVVVMNADGTRGIAAEAAIGATVPGISWIVGGLLSLAGTAALVAIVLLVVALRVPKAE